MAWLGFVWILSLLRGFDALLEGDVAVPRSTTGEKVRDSFLLNPSQLWSNGLVPFVFEALQLEGGGEEPIFSEQHKQMIRDAMAHISEQVPCIKFREVLAGYSGAHLIFSCMGDAENDPSGCWAYVGCQGAQGGKGGQTVNYGAEGCFNMGTVVHEILHSLGATHEQNREDRDQYVRIVEDQIIEESKKNFEKKDALFSSYGTPYDYDSVMHYDEDAFSMSGTKTIVPLIANITLRPVRSKPGMSRIDTMELARVYDSLTTEDCYKREAIMAYLDTVEKMLNQSSHQCPEVRALHISACVPYKEHIEFTAGGLRSVSMIQTASSCHSLCQTIPACTRWSWNIARERCYLKTGEHAEEQQRDNFISGLKNVEYCS